MSIWYRIDLLLKHNSHNIKHNSLSTASSTLNESVAEKTDSRVQRHNSIIKLDRGHVIKLIHSQNTLKPQQFALIEKKLFVS